jgi:hypothetical protein
MSAGSRVEDTSQRDTFRCSRCGNEFLKSYSLTRHVSTYVSKENLLVMICRLVAVLRIRIRIRKRAGSEFASGFISLRHGSADPDPDPDPHQNVMDPQHCSVVSSPPVNARSVTVPGSIVASFDTMVSGGQRGYRYAF